MYVVNIVIYSSHVMCYYVCKYLWSQILCIAVFSAANSNSLVNDGEVNTTSWSITQYIFVGYLAMFGRSLSAVLKLDLFYDDGYDDKFH